MRARRLLPCVAVIVLTTACTSGTGGHAAAPSTVGLSRPVAASSTSTVPAKTSAPMTTSHAPTRSVTPTHSASPTPPQSTPAQSFVTLPPGTGPLVVLDPGHNGGANQAAEDDKLVPAGYGHTKPCNTTGTSTDAGYPEHAFTWDVANRVAKILRAHGVRVLLTRDSDDGVGPCVNVRAAIESTKGVAAAIAIHADGGPSSGHGFHICEDSRTPQGASAATVAKSKQLSLDMRSALEGGSGLTRSTYIGGGTALYPRDDLAGLNLSTNPTTFLELGNMRNSGDAAIQSSAAGRQKIADAVAAGIMDYLHL